MGDERELSISLPLDEDGFLRRECPTCEREFKWLYTESEEDSVKPDGAGYFCPYCAVQAPSNAWWTPAQLERMQAIAAQEVLGPELKKFGKSIERMNRSGGLISASFDVDLTKVPDENVEDNSGRRVDFPCHPEEPVKVDEAWTKSVHCLVCGTPAP